MFDLNKFNLKVIKEGKDNAVFEIGPLPQGYGHTIANIIRRILLSSIKGSAITSIKVNGVFHEYSSLYGMNEDILKLIMNLKNISFICNTSEPQILKLKVKGPMVVRAEDIETTSSISIVNKELILTELSDQKVKLDVEIIVETGVGYKFADEGKRKEIGVIPVDSNFSPVKRVNVKIGEARFGQQVDLDQITLDIDTNGSVKPIDCLKQATEILLSISSHFVEVANGKVVEMPEKQISQKAQKLNLNDLNLDKLNVSTRLYNCLKKSGYDSLSDLNGKTRKETLEIKGLGEKSKIELEKLVEKYNIEIKD